LKWTPKEKRDIIGSIYPEKLSFDGEHYRTDRINEAVRQICLIETELQECKNGTSEENFDLCRLAEREGLAALIPERWGLQPTGVSAALPAAEGRLSNLL